MPLPQSQHTLDDDVRPDFSAGRKLGEVEQALLWSWLQEEPECPSRVLLDKAAPRHIVITVSLRHVNRWRAARGRNRCPGRPGRTDGSQPIAAGAEVGRVTPSLSCVGVHLFAHWLDHQEAFVPVVAQLPQAIEAYQPMPPDDDFALLHHREQTLGHRFQALFFAPLMGIDRLSEFETREHPRQTLIGRGDQSSTLRQLLGQLERVDAAASLMAVLGADRVGPLISVDGHMIASWSRRAMHQGKITMLLPYHGGLTRRDCP